MKTTLAMKITYHGEALLKLFPNAMEKDPIKLCKKLRRIENLCHRESERFCNGEITDTEWEHTKDTTIEKLNELLGSHDVPIIINGDPRGYALKINDGYMYNNQDRCQLIPRDWGGYGILAPDLL